MHFALLTSALAATIITVPAVAELQGIRSRPQLLHGIDNATLPASALSAILRQHPTNYIQSFSAIPEAIAHLLPLPISGQDVPHQLNAKRGVSPKKWTAAVCKGNRLLDLMRGTIAEASELLGRASESPFTKPAELKKWGWSVTSEKTSALLSPTVDPILENIGVGIGTGVLGDPYTRNKILSVHQHSPVTVDGRVFRESLGRYVMLLNPKEGFIAAYSSHSPAYKTPDQEHTDLQRWSDLAYLGYSFVSSLVDVPIQPPRWILRMSIINDDTLLLIDQAVQNLPEDQWPLPPNRPVLAGLPGLARVPDWPGIPIGMETDEGKALLASPNGAGVAWLLAQRKQVFGQKVVDKVVLFKEFGRMYMLFEVADA